MRINPKTHHIIPDTTDDMVCISMTIPRTWEFLIPFHISNMARGRFWDRETGNVSDAKQAAWGIYDSINVLDSECVELDDIQDILDRIEVLENMNYLFSMSHQSLHFCLFLPFFR